MRPIIGSIVHYIAPGSADGTYPPAHRAAIITVVTPDHCRNARSGNEVGITVFNPTGIHFVECCDYDPFTQKPFTWHWPEQED